MSSSCTWKLFSEACSSWLGAVFHVESTQARTQSQHKKRILIARTQRAYRLWDISLLVHIKQDNTRTKSFTNHSYRSVVSWLGHFHHLTLRFTTREPTAQCSWKATFFKGKKTSARCCESCLRLLYLNRKLILRTYINSFALAVPLSLASMRLSLCAQSACRSIILAVNAASHCG